MSLSSLNGANFALTMSSSVRAREDIKTAFDKRMAIGADRFSEILKAVLLMGHKLQVIGIDAGANPALVMDLQIVGNVADESLVSKCVALDKTSVNREVGVSVSAFATVPDPASVLVKRDEIKEAIQVGSSVFDSGRMAFPKEKMLWVNTKLIDACRAFVKHAKTIWNRTVEYHPTGPVSCFSLRSVARLVQLAVSQDSFGSRPQPAAIGLFDLRPKAFEDCIREPLRNQVMKIRSIVFSIHTMLDRALGCFCNAGAICSSQINPTSS